MPRRCAQRVGKVGGHATLIRAAEAVRAAVPCSSRSRAGSRPGGAGKGKLRPQGHLQSRPDVRTATMQTNFTLAQLADPEIAEAEQILRKCVHCGFCTATCPTFVLLGDERDSPRGRIYLIKEMLEGDKPPTAGRRQACRSLPVVPVLHDDLPVGRELHAPGRSGRRAHRGDLSAAVLRSRRARALSWLMPRPGMFRSACGRPGSPSRSRRCCPAAPIRPADVPAPCQGDAGTGAEAVAGARPRPAATTFPAIGPQRGSAWR